MDNTTLLRLTALRLRPAAMEEVVAIITDLETGHAAKIRDLEIEIARDKASAADRSRSYRSRRSSRDADVTQHTTVTSPSTSEITSPSQLTSLQPSINNKDSLDDNDSFLLTSPSGVLLEKKEGVVIARERKSRANQGHRLPDDWEPPQELFNFSLSLGFSEKEFLSEMAKFKDHWRAEAGANARKVDWVASARKWLRNAMSWRRSPQHINGNAPRPGSWADRAERSNRAYDKLSEYIEANTDDAGAGCGTGQETSPQLRLVEPS